MSKLTFVFSEKASKKRGVKQKLESTPSRGGGPLIMAFDVPTGFYGHDVVRVGKDGQPFAATHVIEGDDIESQLVTIRQEFDDSLVVHLDAPSEDVTKLIDKTVDFRGQKPAKALTADGEQYLRLKYPHVSSVLFEMRDHYINQEAQKNSLEAARGKELGRYNNDFFA